ncbi:MAG TPA: ferritin [Spirochaetota bacterium]|nr:ferritin [Spirochaetota bacterium]HOS31590.1 ferritin [Spirochaetota bacterium]HOS54777.1 ferritin [Spirochaetota bacterium]HPK62341.1 ferritin [Spirochaetota bacterium]HQF77421.1 ferritin [Spirochaetota bacterium]
MVISSKINDIINEQINKELFSSYLYLSMAAYFESINFEGFANWMRKQSNEENNHAMKFFNYIYERGGKVTLKSIKEPKAEWKSPLDAFLEAYEHEKFITDSIYKILDAAKAEKDYATENFLAYYIKEQVEEEDSAVVIVEKLKQIGDNFSGLMIMDSRLGKRE